MGNRRRKDLASTNLLDRRCARGDCICVQRRGLAGVERKMGSKEEEEGGIRSKSRRSNSLRSWCIRSIGMLKGDEEERMQGERGNRSNEGEKEVEVDRCSVAALGKLMRVDLFSFAR